MAGFIVLAWIYSWCISTGFSKTHILFPPQVETHANDSRVHPCARICVEALKDLCIEISLVSCHVMPLQPKLSPFTKAGFWLSLDRWVSYVNPSDAGAVLWHGPHFPCVSKPQLLHSVISSNILLAPSIYCEWPVLFSFPWFASFKPMRPYATIPSLLAKRISKREFLDKLLQ